ncbi:MAG: Permease family protein [Candidatus Moranbacteria bacterium GW2011_GWA2_39_41]|nr:MAG: Permease family protein [Candidatus Moranbacteria bacterium GW2011_GWA2_39_41]
MSIFYPIQLFADWLTYSVFGIIRETLLASAVNFFIFDTIKIILLLFVIIFAVSLIRSFLPPEKIRNILSHEKKYVGNILASLLGIITPFCSCSAVPLFLGFVQAGVPLGTTFSFLVASPMINEVALVLLLGMFGWKIALTYVVSGLLIAIFSGMVIERMEVRNLVEGFALNGNGKNFNLPELSWKERIDYARTYTLDIVKKVWLYVVIGVGLGAWIHGYVPTDFLAQYAGSDNWYAVPLAVVIGIPLYSNAAGVIPLVGALTEKGVAMGTTLAFMMAVTALSLPEFMILKKVMKTKLIIIFASIVGMGIIFTGYLFNLILAKGI